MGSNLVSYALVSMTNNDVYYLESAEAKRLLVQLETNEQPEFYRFIDAKSGAEVAIATVNISSVVIKGGRHA